MEQHTRYVLALRSHFRSIYWVLYVSLAPILDWDIFTFLVEFVETPTSTRRSFKLEQRIIDCHRQAEQWLFRQPHLTVSVLLQAFSLLEPDDADANFRHQPVYCGQVEFPVVNFERRLRKMLQQYDQQKHRSRSGAVLAWRFLRLHPFVDGNGRMARLLISYHYGRRVIMKDDHGSFVRFYLAASASSPRAFVRLVRARATRALPRVNTELLVQNAEQYVYTSCTSTTTYEPPIYVTDCCCR